MNSKWPLVPLGEVLTQYKEYIESPEPKIYPKLSVKLYGKGVIIDSPTDGTTLKMKRHQIAKSGQVILSEIWGKKGAIGFVPPEGEGALCTSHFFLFDVNSSRIDQKYLQAIFTANYLQDQLDSEAKGTTGYAAVRPKILFGAVIPLPPLDEQRRIVARIEELAARIEEARELQFKIERNLQNMLLGAYRRITNEVQFLPMSIVAPLKRRPIEIEIFETYYELGIRSFGRGTFHKPPISGASLGTKRIFHIENEDLLFNIVFAWEGAIAVAKPEDRGHVGSHRFLTCVPQEDFATSRFLCFHFLTDKGLTDIGNASPGGAGRNRTLGLKALEKIKVPVPPIEKQLWFNSLQAKIDAIKCHQAETATELDALLPAVLGQAFRGEL